MGWWRDFLDRFTDGGDEADDDPNDPDPFECPACDYTWDVWEHDDAVEQDGDVECPNCGETWNQADDF